ncbi:MAG: hypothetical protein QJR14_06485 [Bacillota bacterium]|nr:hypothetical protein [Bacillota bacterium]
MRQLKVLVDDELAAELERVRRRLRQLLPPTDRGPRRPGAATAAKLLLRAQLLRDEEDPELAAVIRALRIEDPAR